ncbi:hypothetical protein BCR35DRAFT_311167 [Leucosporidium creatinivorum]|uniref:Ubiquitin carboxyl-terminal hydrolase n=1 Tax=Leucosporidium creatinivorum TaxID=106004 RepID=A0A1Y2CB71_9BASI|nr:hypothetical protein BCR35DRAFT_311167 [Leucosporidium creatinivorum]
MTGHDSGSAGPSSAPLAPLEPTQTTESRPEPQQAAASTSKLNPHSASFSFSFLQPDQVPSTSTAAYPPTGSSYHSASYPTHQLDQQQQPPHYPYPPLLQGYSQPQPYPIDLHQQFQWAQGPAKGPRGAAQGRWQQQSYYPPPPPLQHAPPPQRPPLHPSHSAQNGIYLPLPNGPPLTAPSHLTSPSLQPALLPAFTLQPSSHPINSAFSAPPNQQQTVTATPRLPGLSHPPSANAHSQQPHRARRARPPPPALAPALSLGPNVRPPPEYKSRFPTAVPVQSAAAKKDEVAKDKTASARSTSATGRTTPTVSTATAQTSPTSTSTPALLSPTTTVETSVLEDSTVESSGGAEQVTPVEEKEEEKLVTPVEEKVEPSTPAPVPAPAPVEAPSTPAPAPKPAAPTPVAAAEPVVAPSTPSTSTPSAPTTSAPAPTPSTPAPTSTTPSAAPSTPKSPPPSAWGASGPKKSWADLLRSPGSSVPPPLLPNGQLAAAIKEHVPPKPISRKSLAETLAGLDLSSSTKDGHVVTPRGLVNNGNLCFANAILQVLVYCAPFWRLLEGVRREVKGGQMSAGGLGGQVGSLEAMIMFLEEFRSTESPRPLASSSTAPATAAAITSVNGDSTPSSSTRPRTKSTSTPVPSTPSTPSAPNGLPSTPSSSRPVASSSTPSRPVASSSTPSRSQTTSDYLDPFLPTHVYSSLKPNKRFDAMTRGQQEDAEEFLGFFLDTLHEELLGVIDRVDGGKEKGKKGGKEEEEGWEEVGSKGKTATTRTTETRESPITKIFGGQLRSVLRCQGQKDSITLEPYQRLQLDIQPDHVRTITDALLHLTQPEPLPDFLSRAGHRVDATKQVYLETFPPVLILHLKRFLYDNVGGVQKSGKIVGYETELEVPEEVVGPSKRTGKKVRYQLFGVVYHHGVYASGGHYTVAVRQQINSDSWLHIDDTSIRPISPSEVAVGPGSSFNSDDNKGAYLLLYNRLA